MDNINKLVRLVQFIKEVEEGGIKITSKLTVAYVVSLRPNKVLYKIN